MYLTIYIYGVEMNTKYEGYYYTERIEKINQNTTIIICVHWIENSYILFFLSQECFNLDPYTLQIVMFVLHE